MIVQEYKTPCFGLKDSWPPPAVSSERVFNKSPQNSPHTCPVSRQIQLSHQMFTHRALERFVRSSPVFSAFAVVVFFTGVARGAEHYSLLQIPIMVEDDQAVLPIVGSYDGYAGLSPDLVVVSVPFARGVARTHPNHSLRCSRTPFANTNIGTWRSGTTEPFAGLD